tara:strand:+ start:2316 stop:2537 length:222 start_codon:yes stop_codon:yes gene_type:complete
MSFVGCAANYRPIMIKDLWGFIVEKDGIVDWLPLKRKRLGRSHFGNFYSQKPVCYCYPSQELIDSPFEVQGLS